MPDLLATALGQPWYHTIQLDSEHATPGAVDLRKTAGKVLPESLVGTRALDVGCFDGFWSFEMERRGAEVVATDLDSYAAADWPPTNRERLAREAGERTPGERFHLAAELLGSRVRRVGSSIYELEPASLGGTFDLALIGALLLHLRDPVGGLERVRSVLRPGARLIVVEPFSPILSLLRPRSAVASLQARATNFNWWVANLACLADWLVLAGFEQPRRTRLFRLQAKGTMRRWHVALEATRAV